MSHVEPDDDAARPRAVAPPPNDTTATTDAEATAAGALGIPSAFQRLVGRSRRRVAAGQAQASELLERHHDRPLLDVGVRIHRRDKESAGTVVGSALAFRLFLFFVPLMLFVVGLFGFLASLTAPEDVSDAAGLTGTLAAQINTALTQPSSTRWVATFAGLSGMALAGRSLSKVMVTAACLSWRLPVTTKASLRVIGSVVGLIVGIGVVSTIVNRIRLELGVGAASVSFVAAFLIYAVVWMAMSMLLPRATTDPGALLPGAILVGGTLAAMQAISQLYLPDKLGRAMVLSMSLDAVIFERFGSISRVVFSLPAVRVLPRKSPWIRRFFDLGGDEA
jgi:uncharacterized BrkB/YihY/UPF0761 family membrane protein